MASIVIEIKQVRDHGLDTYQVLINGTLMNTYMSMPFAEQKKRAYIKSWNNDREATVARANKKGA